MYRKLLVLSVAGTLVAAPAAAQDLTLDEVLGNYYEAIGGLDAWKSVQSMKMTGTRSMGRGGDIPFTQIVKRPGKIRMEFTMQGMTAVRAYDGETAWMSMPFRGSGEPQVMERVGTLAEDADIDGPLVGYEESGHQLELVGLEEADATPAYKLKLTMSDGQEVFYYLDAEYFVPIMITRTGMGGMPGGGRGGGGTPAEIQIIVSDYKEVGGLMIPHSIQTRRIGSERPPQSVTIETIELNVEVADSIFELPESGTGN
ncbi:MAG: hypothetical protein PVG79_04190 [Gemmatimonadales bacterium]|jgi:outer membrane lipoprotein-sorting protein